MAKRPQKRRKLSVASSVTSTTTTATTTTTTEGTGTGAISRSSSLRLAADAFVFPPPDIRDLACVSCHRALGTNPALGNKQSHFVVCPRCRATSCTICSRTCTSIPASQPPTPLLSFSPSPPGTPLAPAEDRTLNIPTEFHLDETPRTTRTTVTMMHERTESARRRRYSDIVDDDERTVVGAEEDDSLLARVKGVDDSGASPGCGRVMCKNCCIENIQTGATTCYDCYGLPSPVHATNTDDCRRSAYAYGSQYSSANPSMTSLLL